MYVVINDKHFAEIVDISTERFVEYVLGHISNLGFSDGGEKGVKSSSKREIS